jgi:hypothetical protein
MRRQRFIEMIVARLSLVLVTAVPTTVPAQTLAGMSGTTSRSASSLTTFPDASNTGVPDGVTLTAYAGPMTITRGGTIIDAKIIRGMLVIAADNVVIKRSKLVGNVDADRPDVHITILDSEVDGGASWRPAIGYRNITMSRVNVHGARASVLCGSNCLIEDSWLHGQYLKPGSNWHVNGYISNGGTNVVIRHNTLACEPLDNSNGGGCTGPASSFGDFGPLRNITYDGNLFVAGPGGFCLRAGYNPGKPYGRDPTGIAIKNNVFQRGANRKCGVWGAVTSFRRSGVGNVFSNNKWDDGKPVYP